MTVYELIKELAYYPADAEVRAKVSGAELYFDIVSSRYEFRPPIVVENNRVLLEVEA